MSTATRTIIEDTENVLLNSDRVRIHYSPSATEPVAGEFDCIETTGLCPAICSYAVEQYPSGLYRHQHEALCHVLAGENCVVSTRTSSGKSLIYSLPVLDSLLENDSATALFIYPQRALANDQMLKLQDAVDAIPELNSTKNNRPHFVARYDGATPQGLRPRIRDEAQVILTNPDMLHFAMLQYHETHWARFFSNLRYIAIDECHEYRGIFGTNVAYILRRLRQVCELHGSDPTVVATSATIRDPQNHMELLTGRNFTCVGPQKDGSKQGARKYWMASSHEHFYDFGRKLALKLADEGLTVLAFCPGRVAAERMMARVQSAHDEELSHVRVYRAGLSPAEREDIEHGLRDKSVRLVFSTSALELGIDIGEVDVVVCIGLPGSMMSLWQRAGRAARAGKEGAVVLIPGDTPIDTYYAEHPNELFAKDNEPLVLNMSNRRVVCQHYACAAAEVGGDEDRIHHETLGESTKTVRQLRSEGRLDLDVFYRADPHMQVNIRSMGEGSYKIEHGQDEVGEIDEFHLLRETYRNAIYRHGGCGYRVKDVIRGRRKVILEREYSWNDTTPYIQKKIKLKRRHSIADYRDVMVATVAIDVTEFLVSVIEKDRSGKTVNQWNGNAGMPSHPLPTEGTMLLLRPALWGEFAENFAPCVAKSALQSCERLLSGLFPTISGPCDKQDYSSASEVQADHQAAIYLYDMVYDGVDLTTAAFSKMPELIDKAIDRLTTCECDSNEGCFRCIANPRYPEPTNKNATADLLQRIQQCFVLQKPTLTLQQDEGIEASDGNSTGCPACGDIVTVGDRFCRNCGQKMEA